MWPKLMYILMPFTIFWASSAAMAHYSTMDTADVIERDERRLIVESQFVTSETSGINALGSFDFPVRYDSVVRGVLGFGTLDFQAGLFFKWAPIPDIDDQPAIAFMTGVSYADVKDKAQVSVRLHPIISKKFNSDLGKVSPYASIPFGMASRDGESSFPVQFVVGSSLVVPSLKNFDFIAEIGVDVQDAFSYLSAGIIMYFDDTMHLKSRD